MKKLLSLSAAMLLCFLAHSQEAKLDGNHADLTVVSRLDLNPYLSGGEFGFDHGNSSIYTLFEGNLGDNFTWTLVNHWISSLNGDPDLSYAWPYESLGRSDSLNWIDYLVFEWSQDNWAISFGKEGITTGGFEYELWDWEVHYGFASPFWNAFTSYQWGVKPSYTTSDEKHSFSLQMSTSPCGEHPFASNLWAYSAMWRGEIGFYESKWSYTALECGKGMFDQVISLGNKFNISDSFSLVVDWLHYAPYDGLSPMGLNGSTFREALAFAPSERFDFEVQSYQYFPKGEDAWFNLGAAAHFYPLKDSQDLRLHAVMSYNIAGQEKYLGLTLGALYNFQFSCW